MGRGCGKGGAQLGKAVKGKSKERKKIEKAKKADDAKDGMLEQDIKMMAEYEKLNKLAEAQRVRLKKLQQQEAYNTRINKKLLLNMHRHFMRKDKVATLRKEIEILAQTHERDVDRKDAIIAMLAKDLDDAEEQHQTMQRTHMNQSQIVVHLHLSKMATLEAEFQRDLKALKEEFNSEHNFIVSQHSQDTKLMRDIIVAVDDKESDRIQLAKQDHETEREEIRNKNLENINEMRISLESKRDELEKAFDLAHQTYVEKTDQNNRLFLALERRDQRASIFIDKRKQRIENGQNNLMLWRKKLENNYKECVARNNALKEQKEAIAKHCNVLKARMKRYRANEAKRLTELTVMSREALLSNEEKLHRAEKLLQLAELSRKFETEREKVLPFYDSTLMDKKDAPLNVDVAKTEEKDTTTKDAEIEFQARALLQDGTPVEAWGELENFFKKYNKVLLDKLAIAQERRRLQKENGDLRAILKQYVDGIAITEDVVDKENPLLIVNGRINLLAATQVRRQPGGMANRPMEMVGTSTGTGGVAVQAQR